MEHELEKLKICLNLEDVFWCSFIILDDMNVLDVLQEEFKDKVSFVSDCFTVDDLYNCFAPYHERHDGITHFYQRFTEAYRDRLWKNNKGQIHFVLSHE